MDKTLFNELLESVQEAGQITRGEKQAARSFEYNALDVKKIREKTGLTQERFARLMGISLRTYQNWEQGHRRPKGAAAALLTIFERDPQHTLKALDR